MSFYTMAYFGMAPFGALGGGAAAERIGAPAAIAIGGALTLAAVARFVRARPGVAAAVTARLSRE
jgi:hypothetical protein